MGWLEGASVLPQVYYTVYWAAACANASLERQGQGSYEEYWTGNLQTGVLSGPRTQDGPAVCGCTVPTGPGPSESFADTAIASWLGPAVALVGAAIAALRARRWALLPKGTGRGESDNPAAGRR